MLRAIFTAVTVWAALASNGPHAQPPIPPPPDWSALLNCSAPVFAVEQQICAEPRLLAANGRLEAAYAEAMTSAGIDRGQLARDQEAWSKTRNQCAFERVARQCILQRQTRRTAEIDALLRAVKDGVQRPSGRF